jgi:endo-1,4-beta-mannosidase
MRLRETFTIIGLLLLGVVLGGMFLFVASRTTTDVAPGRTATPAQTGQPQTTHAADASDAPGASGDCSAAEVQAALKALPAYTPTQNVFVEIVDGAFYAGGVRFVVRGVNYYPVQSPWRRFITETTRETLRHEFTVMRGAGLNTLRVFLWHEPLFQCGGTVPDPEAFIWLDAFIHQAADAGFRLIVTLNDLPDLETFPLYDAPEHTQAQTRYIVSRYRYEPAIMAWDLRNEGDIDYRERFEREAVLAWLEVTSAMVREADPNHLVTAGWLSDSLATAPYVDFLSFHHWQGAGVLAARIAALRQASDQPILLQEVGFSTLGYSETEQATMLAQVIDTAEGRDLAGWLVWTAFDFPREATCTPPDCPSPNNSEHYFGLWRTDYSPKPAAEVVRGVTGGP